MEYDDVKSILEELYAKEDNIYYSSRIGDVMEFVDQQQERISDTENVLTGAISTIENMKCCGNCNYSNLPSDNRSNAGCFGCKQVTDCKTVLHGWKKRESEV